MGQRLLSSRFFLCKIGKYVLTVFPVRAILLSMLIIYRCYQLSQLTELNNLDKEHIEGI